MYKTNRKNTVDTKDFINGQLQDIKILMMIEF